MHKYNDCQKTLKACRFCRAEAERICRLHSIDVQELDSTLHFNEQEFFNYLPKEKELDPADDGIKDAVENPNARVILGLDRPKGDTKRKPKVLPLSKIIDGLNSIEGKP